LALKSALEKAKTNKQETKELSAANTEIRMFEETTTSHCSGNIQKDETVKESAVIACSKESAASYVSSCSLASNIENPKIKENSCCEPSKKDCTSLFPTMKWYQTKDDVIASFLLGDVTKYELSLAQNSLNFSADVPNGSK
jgi:hypothetical protein